MLISLDDSAKNYILAKGTEKTISIGLLERPGSV